jgi:hypothetical protein
MTRRRRHRILVLSIYDLNGTCQPELKRSATTGDACSVGLKKGNNIVNGKKVVAK